MTFPSKIVVGLDGGSEIIPVLNTGLVVDVVAEALSYAIPLAGGGERDRLLFRSYTILLILKCY